MQQRIVSGAGCLKELPGIVREKGLKRLMLVCGKSFDALGLDEIMQALPAQVIPFTAFTPNPLYEQVLSGMSLFSLEGCDGLLAIGGGSAMDVAKCIKLFAGMEPGGDYLLKPPGNLSIPLFVAPTTAGTGSESTRYAVIYQNGQKQNVAHEALIPDIAFLDAQLLRTLPLYQKKCTLLDALCQGIEAWWSVRSTEESTHFAKKAVSGIARHMDAYLSTDFDPMAAEAVLCASNDAGRAIDSTQTTAPHALSYQMTSLFKLPHGHAVAVGLPVIWRYMLGHMDECVDPRGESHLKQVFGAIAGALGQKSPEAAIEWFIKILKRLDILPPSIERTQTAELAAVNTGRLANNPVRLDEQAIAAIYAQIGGITL